ncbi:hypothetical protein D1953_00260 [Peribacillus asahii]|uniref:Uncharacterized protein n=1 Tax=Peribacillus asahii TaxID=228899 RepID=A0A398BNX5_9BACI|nr:hypothetical protein [Peribacillus asahii]RID89046.1 hypothetical protein D1953_00260 [Peribacillus asahii]
MKKSVKILLGFSVIVMAFLLFIVFKGVSNSSETIESAEVPKEMSYLKDTEKLYTVKEYSVKKERYIEYEEHYIGKSQEFDTWYGADTYLETENEAGLFYGSDKVLAYPVEKGKEWTIDSYTFTIESVDKTVTIPAGTFDNVAEVKTIQKGAEEYSITYYAKGVGQILRESVDANGKKTMRFELQEIKEKKSKEDAAQ